MPQTKQWTKYVKNPSQCVFWNYFSQVNTTQQENQGKSDENKIEAEKRVMSLSSIDNKRKTERKKERMKGINTSETINNCINTLSFLCCHFVLFQEISSGSIVARTLSPFIFRFDNYSGDCLLRCTIFNWNAFGWMVL